jgi:hypothetical protein
MKSAKPSRPLSTRGGVNDLVAKLKPGGGGADLRDYAKGSSLTPAAEPASILNLAKPKLRGG